MLEAPTEGAWGLTVTDDFIDKAAGAGFTAVRLPVRWSNHAGAAAPFTIDSTFMNRVASIVDKLLAKGLVVILNMHHYRQLDGDAPDPGELTVPDAAVDVRFVMLWDQIAAHFQGRSARLVFELYNEPHGRQNGEPWNVLAARAAGVVRKSNPNRVIVIGPTTWNSASDLHVLKIPNDANVIVTIHNYAPFTFTHQGAEWINPVLPTGVTCCNAATQRRVAQLRRLSRLPISVASGSAGSIAKARATAARAPAKSLVASRPRASPACAAADFGKRSLSS